MTQAPHQTADQGQSTSSFDDRFLDAKLEAVEARTETKFAQLLGKMDLMVQSIAEARTDIAGLDAKITAVDTHARSTKSTIIATVIGAAIGIVGISFAAVAIYESAMGTTASAYQSGMAAAEARQK
jgi:hypothetical protein